LSDQSVAEDSAAFPGSSYPEAAEAGRPEPAKATSARCATTLTERDLELFRRIGVPIDLLEAACIERVSNRDARARFGIQGPASRDMAGIVFPYCSHITGRRVTARVRRDNSEIEGGRSRNKYVSPFGDPRHLYFPPGAVEKLRSSETPIVLVEAEKSALALTSWAKRMGMDLLALGMGGCWSWRGRIGKTEGADGSRVDITGPLPDLSVCDQRRVFVVMDANVAGNAKVRQAEKALAISLAERKCDVQIRHLPSFDDVNGPDDLIAIRGDDAMRSVLLEPIRSSDGPDILEAAMEPIGGEAYASNMERFYAFCVALQRLRGGQAIALPVERIARLFGCHWSTIAAYRRRAVIDGWLQPEKKAIAHVRAGTFFVSLPIITISETSLTKNKSNHMGPGYPSPLSENLSSPLSGEEETTLVSTPGGSLVVTGASLSEEEVTAVESRHAERGYILRSDSVPLATEPNGKDHATGGVEPRAAAGDGQTDGEEVGFPSSLVLGQKPETTVDGNGTCDSGESGPEGHGAPQQPDNVLATPPHIDASRPPAGESVTAKPGARYRI
jgi:Domain of unknown function (DUF3854)